MSELKLCPFCGDKGIVSEFRPFGVLYWRGECLNEEVCGAIGPERTVEADAGTAWNTRHPDAIDSGNKEQGNG